VSAEVVTLHIVVGCEGPGGDDCPLYGSAHGVCRHPSAPRHVNHGTGGACSCVHYGPGGLYEQHDAFEARNDPGWYDAPRRPGWCPLAVAPLTVRGAP
jgi:hypothetical protein